jgi:environmental stress-induced protein Ves
VLAIGICLFYRFLLRYTFGTKIIKHSDYRLQSWKNGKGVTREILRSPPEGDLNWRLSMADIVEDGPFSNFSGFERTLILLSGEPIELKHNDGPTHKLSLLTPYTFSGDWNTYASIKAPGLDFNVMIRRGFTQSQVTVQTLLKGELKKVNAIFFVISGELKIKNDILQSHDTVDCQSETVKLEALSSAEIIEISFFRNARD